MVDDSPGIPPKRQHTPCEQLGLAEGLSSVHIEGEAASGKKWSHPSMPQAQRASELASLTYKTSCMRSVRSAQTEQQVGHVWRTAAEDSSANPPCVMSPLQIWCSRQAPDRRHGGGSQCMGRWPAAPEGGTEPLPLSPLLRSSGRACLTALATPASSLGLRVTPQGQSLTRKTTVFAFSFPGWVVSYSLRRGRISALNVAT